MIGPGVIDHRIVRDSQRPIPRAIPADNDSVGGQRGARAIHGHVTHGVIILTQGEPAGIGVDRATGGNVHRAVAAAVARAEKVATAASEGIQVGVRPGDIQNTGGHTSATAHSAIRHAHPVVHIDCAGVQIENSRPSRTPNKQARAYRHRRVAGNRDRPRGLARVPVVINAHVEFAAGRERAAGHVQRAVATFMSEANPATAGKRAAAGEIHHTHRRIGAGVAKAHADEVIRGNCRTGTRDVHRSKPISRGTPVVATHVELIAIGLAEQAAIGNRERAGAALADIDPPGILIDPGICPIDQHVALRSRIDGRAEPPVLGDAPAIGHIDRPMTAVVPADQQIAAAALRVLPQAPRTADIDRSRPAAIATDGGPPIDRHRGPARYIDHARAAQASEVQIVCRHRPAADAESSAARGLRPTHIQFAARVQGAAGHHHCAAAPGADTYAVIAHRDVGGAADIHRGVAVRADFKARAAGDAASADVPG